MTQTRPAFRALLLTLVLGGCAAPDDSPGDSPADGFDFGGVPIFTPGTRRPAWCTGSGGEGIEATKARGTAEGGNATGVHRCTGSGYNHYESGPGSTGGTQLHVIGIYAPGPEGTVEVRVKRSGASVLVLSAYEATRWNVSVEPGARVERILVTGFHSQDVQAPAGIPVAVRSVDQTGEYLRAGYQWPDQRTTDLVDAAEALSGVELTTYRGCYSSKGFDIDEPGVVKPPHAVSTRRERAIPAGCDALAGESAHCLTLNQGTPSLIGLDSGELCSGTPARSGALADATSVAWQGDYVYGCIHDRGVARVSLVDGSVDIAPIDCRAVTAYGSGLLVMQTKYQLAWFDSFDAVARRDTSCVSGHRLLTSRMTVLGDRAYFAWHSTHEVETLDFAKGGALQSLPLEGYDDWILGMDATEDGQLLILGGWSAPGVYVFDAATGASRGKVGMSTWTSGLACQRR